VSGPGGGAEPDVSVEPLPAATAQPLDLTSDPQELASVARRLDRPRTVKDPRETTRSQLARWLMGLLTLTVVTLLLLAGLQLAGIVGASGTSIRDLAQIVLTPVVTLTGTALGFYFGSQSTTGESAGGSAPPRAEAEPVRLTT
jgi:lipid-binding SYLF domain-containing protein